MNEIGIYLEIARFYFRWQAITTYCGFMLPVSLFLRKYSYLDQYLYGVFFL